MKIRALINFSYINGSTAYFVSATEYAYVESSEYRLQVIDNDLTMTTVCNTRAEAVVQAEAAVARFVARMNEIYNPRGE